MDTVYNQSKFAIRFDWGQAAVEQFVAYSDVLIIVDVLSFSTCVDIAVSRGAIVYPYRYKDETAVAYARSNNAVLASPDRHTGFSLSPASLLHIPPGTRLVLPSPNGATLALATGRTPAFSGCLRNAQTVAQVAQDLGKRISVVAAGERWPDGSLRPALEDLLGAGAIIHHLHGPRSPEAALAEASFMHFQHNLADTLVQCSSGQELIERGCDGDVVLAAALNTSHVAPVFTPNCAYVPFPPVALKPG